VVICLDGLGFSLGANEAIYGGLRHGAGTSAGLLVPAPWARGAAASYRGEDVGVHLTLNAELDLYRWGPITHAPSLLDGDGGFPRTVEDAWDHADLDEVRREWRAQIERAIYWGFDVSHLAVHLGAITDKAEFFDVYLDLAEEFQLPVRLPSPGEEERLGFPFRDLARDRGVLFPERVIGPDQLREASEDVLISWLTGLPEGTSELHVQPCLDTPELRAACPRWAERTASLALVAGGPAGRGSLGRALELAGVSTAGYRGLRAQMRSAMVPAADTAR